MNGNQTSTWMKRAATLLSLCGVRVAYYAPGNGVFAPVIRK